MVVGTAFDVDDSGGRYFEKPAVRTASNEAFSFFLDSAGFLWISGHPDSPTSDPPIPGYYGGWVWSPALAVCRNAIRANLPWVDIAELTQKALQLQEEWKTTHE